MSTDLRDFPMLDRLPNGTKDFPRREFCGLREISRSKGVGISHSFIINRLQGIYQKIHPYSSRAEDNVLSKIPMSTFSQMMKSENAKRGEN